MPPLDFVSLSLLTFLSQFLMALALPFAMGSDAISPAARRAQGFFLLQASAWACILVASRHRGSGIDMLFAALATLSVAGAQWNMAQALQHWLGPRPGRPWLALCCIAGPVGFILLWSVLPWRFAWFSAMQAMGLLLLAHMCLHPQQPCARGWRWVLSASAGTVAAVLLVRAALAAARPDLLGDFAAPSAINHGFVILSQIAALLTLVAVLVAWRDESHQRLLRLALTDTLTGIANRRAFETQGQGLLLQAQRQRTPVAVLLLDLDHFKTINDQHGHAMGDRALRLFASTVERHLRGGDLLARWGGEEFVLLVQALPAVIDTLHQRLQQAVAQQSQTELGFALHFSAGCARPYGPHAGAQTYALEPLVQRADEALYLAKQAGRAQMVFAEESRQAPLDFSGTGMARSSPPAAAPHSAPPHTPLPL